MEKVVAVIVTYNRIELLKRCIFAIQSQTFRVDRIVLIDNASTDGTNKWVCSELMKTESRLDYVRMENNIGGAGGFNLGIERALKWQPDWLWLMDDDGMPEKNALETLINSPTNSLIRNSLVLSSVDRNTLCFVLKMNGKLVRTVADLESVSCGVIDGVAFPFNGTLISSIVPRLIGLPIKEMFIWGDEVEYIERAKKNGFKPVLVTNSIHYHPLDKTKKISLFWGRIHISVPESKRRLYILLRNQSYIWARYSIRKLILLLIKYIVYALLKQDKTVICLLVSAIKDGVLGVWNKEAKYAE